MGFEEFFPDPDTLLRLDTEEVADLLLQFLISRTGGAAGLFSRPTLVNESGELGRYAPSRYREVAEAVTEAFQWLQREGFVAPDPQQQSSGEWCYLTKRGRSFKSRADWEAYHRTRVLDTASLDPVLARKVSSLFLRGDYDTAVFQAFKEVEVRVRDAAGLDARLIGTDLMRKAFDVHAGPLADASLLPAERQAMSDLFAGSIGLFKNPTSHRQVGIGPQEAVRLILLADYLLSLVGSGPGQPSVPQSGGC